jgi:DNA-binding response OmpR family regulator
MSGKPFRILICEDHRGSAEALSNVLQLLLKGAIVEIEIAETLGEALEKTHTFQADVTLLDLILPDSPTWQTTVAAIPKFWQPVFAITALDDENQEISKAVYAAGGKSLFRKPLVFKIVELLVLSMIEAHARNLNRENNGNGTAQTA